MTKADVESIRSRSKAGKSGPWVTDWNEMAKKTVFRRASKWVPLSPEVRDQIEREDSHQFAGKASSIPVVATPIFEESK
jgi:recombination protein RecT